MGDLAGVLFRAGAFSELGQYERAVDLLGSALADEPSHPVLLSHLAEALYLGGRVDQATSVAEAALAADPEAIDPRVTLAKCALHRRRFDDALRLMEQVIERQPLHAQALLFHALILARRNSRHLLSRRRARQDIRRALEIRSDDPGCLHWAGQVERALGDEKAAMRYARAGLAIAPTSKELLSFVAGSTSTPAQERYSILSGLLAEDPTGERLHALMRRERWNNRRARYDLQWISVLGVLVVASTTRGAAGIAGLLLVSAAVLVVWKRKTDAAAALPSRSRPPGGRAARTVLSVLLVLWAFALVVGTALLAGGSALGLGVLGCALAAWVGSIAVIDVVEFRAVSRDDRVASSGSAAGFAGAQLVTGLRVFAVLIASMMPAAMMIALLPTAVTIVIACGVIAAAFLLESFVFFAAWVWTTDTTSVDDPRLHSPGAGAGAGVRRP